MITDRNSTGRYHLVNNVTLEISKESWRTRQAALRSKMCGPADAPMTAEEYAREKETRSPHDMIPQDVLAHVRRMGSSIVGSPKHIRIRGNGDPVSVLVGQLVRAGDVTMVVVSSPAAEERLGGTWYHSFKACPITQPLWL
jgi:hypothetical protein